ncbi:hypothetical protein [Mastigocoleus testarum]|uniref:hypothetical protein n=1 Tax=Mastigocoleus testarum TaxID=996925 RepID=UPI00092F06CF|nr:hypothetical protein [Mastigocoleus testarum]
MNICPCCSNLLLRHIAQGRTYWLCIHCRQEMPNFRLELAVSTCGSTKPKSELVAPLLRIREEEEKWKVWGVGKVPTVIKEI